MSKLEGIFNFIFKKKFRMRHYLLLSYLILLMMSGIFQDPFMAIFIALFYEGGVVGLAMLYLSYQQENNQMRWGYFALAVTLIFCGFLWIEFIVANSVGGNSTWWHPR